MLHERGLLETLRRYGDVVPHGSYALDLMVWRDLDIYVCPPVLDLHGFFATGKALATLLSPHRMHFRDERDATDGTLPAGLYWGIYLRDHPIGAWKIDIWAVERDELTRLLRYQKQVAAKLNADNRRAILAIKSRVHSHPEYRRRFSARQVYDAVLEHGVRTVEEYATHMRDASLLA